MDNFVIIDGNSLINRAFYALPPLNNSDGVPTQAVYGFVNMLVKSINDFKPKYLAVAFDLPQPTFRHLKYDGYKAKRKKMPEELAVQVPLLKELLKIMGVKILELAGYEADDIIGTMSKRNHVMTYILTGDRDSLQLIDDTTTVILTKRGITDTLNLDESGLKAEFGLTPAQVIDFKSLAGDSSDNIPGVPGIGEKSALAMIEKYGNLDGIYANINDFTGKTKEKMENGKESAYLSQFLATINTDVPIDCKIEECVFEYPFNNAVRQYFIKNNFKSLIKREDIFAQDENAGAVGGDAVQIASENIEISSVDQLVEKIQNKQEIAFILADNITVAFDEKTQYTLKIRQTLIDDGEDLVCAIKGLSDVLSDEKIHKIVFDGKRLMHILDKFGCKIRNFDDIKLMQFLVDNTVDTEKIDDYCSGMGLGKCVACNLFLLKKSLTEAIVSDGMEKLYYDVELPLETVLFDMEKQGVTVDVAVLDEIGAELSAQSEQLSQEIYLRAGKQFNINSPKQLATVLFEDLKIPYPKKTTKYSTNAEILEELEDEYPIVSDILAYRTVTKLNSTYIEGIRKLVDKNSKVHTEYKQMLTTTGRLSSVEPNLQNIPTRDEEGKKLRKIFKAGEGKVLISADYSQIELRLLAHFSKDAKMVEIFNKDEDLHAMTASEVFGVKPEEVTSQMRRNAKTVNFGIIYGISEFGLSKNLKCSVYQAKKYMETYFEKFKAIKSYFEGVVEEAKERGYTLTMLNRKRKIPELKSPNYMQRQFGERAAMNMPLQGTAADIIKMAMVEVAKQLEKTNSKLILQIHDELIIEADEQEKDVVISILKNGMENACDLAVPLIVDVGCGKSWFDCK